MALGLRKDVEGVMARTAEPLRAGAAAPGYSPPWYSRLLPGDHDPAPTADGTGGAAAAGASSIAAIENPAAMFAGIEAIGSEDAEGRRR
jgi:hypothetical protein